MNRSLLLAALAFSCACSTMRPAAPAPATRRAGERSGPETPSPRPPPDLAIELRPEPKDGRLAVTVVTQANPPTTWSLVEGNEIELSSVSAEDARGAVSLAREDAADGAVVLRAGRPTVAPVSLRYVVARKASSVTEDPCRFVVEPDRARFCGEAVLALPDAPAAYRRVRLRLVADGSFLRDAASSFGLEDELSTTASAFELRSAAFVFGDLTTSSLRAPEGRDHAAALGYVSFDPRWVAAEAAGFRTAIDRWLGVTWPDDDPSAGLLLVGASHPDRPIQIVRRAHGALLSADVSASFSQGARIRVGQLFAQRTVGGALWIGARSGADETRGLWFSEGVSRAVALFVLRDLGVLDDADVAADANGLLAELATSGSDARSLDELAAGAAASDPVVREHAVRALAARGTLVALDLGPVALQKALRGLVREREGASVSMESLLSAIRAAGGEEGEAKAARLARSVVAGTVAIDRGALAPCFTLVERRVAPFELGFVVASGADLSRTVAKVASGSAAARAGLLPGDAVVSLDYRPDMADVPVVATVKRHDGEHTLRFLPAGPSRPGRAFVRAPRAPRSCEPR